MAGTGSGGKLAEIAAFDFIEEDDYRQWTKAVLDLQKNLIMEIEISRRNLEGLLQHTPTATDGKSIKNIGASRRAAKSTSAKLGRASQSISASMAQVRGAFALFEKNYLGEVAAAKNARNGQSAGMRLNRNNRTRTRASSGSSNSTSNTP